MAVDATSAGAILFRDTRGRREYLLLKSRPGDWEFPKGGVEGSEELQQTAIREVKEEAGINDFRLIDGFRKDYDYVFEANGKTIHKTVHLFIAKSYEASAELSTEHRDLQWRDYDQAFNTVTQDGPREILEDAHEFLNELEKNGGIRRHRPREPIPAFQTRYLRYSDCLLDRVGSTEQVRAGQTEQPQESSEPSAETTSESGSSSPLK